VSATVHKFLAISSKSKQPSTYKIVTATNTLQPHLAPHDLLVDGGRQQLVLALGRQVVDRVLDTARIEPFQLQVELFQL